MGKSSLSLGKAFDRELAKRIDGAIPVKLVVDSVDYAREPNTKRESIPEGKYVQGCLVGKTTYAVIEQTVRII